MEASFITFASGALLPAPLQEFRAGPVRDGGQYLVREFPVG